MDLITKNNANMARVFKHGKEPTVGELADLTFNDTYFDGGSAIKDITFESLQDTSFTNQSKNSGTITNQTKN